MKRQRFFHEFAIILLLVVSIGVIAFHTNSSFTGYAVLGQYTSESDCLANNYTWTNTTELQNVTSQAEVVIGGTCFNVTYTDEANCITNNYTWTNTTELQNVTSQVEVVTGGQCVGEETVCDSTHLTLCLDETNCTAAEGYWYGDVCNSEEETACIEAWDCHSWGDCDNGNQTRTCTDSNSCGTTEDKPVIKRECTEEETVDTPITTETVVNTPVVAEITQTCTPSMQCGDWQECINGSQIRICADTNKCNPDEIASTESQSCIVEIKETCFDKIKNQDETDIDCGGKCKKCGFLTVVGNAVSGTVSSVFANKTRIFIFSGSLLIIVAGFFAFRFFSKKKKKAKR
jgi:hypothetical protein